MILSAILIALMTAGGLAVTYVLDEDKPMLWRVSAGCVIGMTVFGTVGFVLSFLFGLSGVAVLASLLITMFPLMMFRDERRRKRFFQDKDRAFGKLQGASVRKFLPFLYYAFFFLVLLFFFERAMLISPEGAILTGGSNNLGDLPYHLGAIFAFTDGPPFPPDNPNFAGTKFTYPFVADLVAAMLLKVGTGIREIMLTQNLALAMSLLVIVDDLITRMVNDRLAGRIAPFLLFLSGGLGFIWFWGDYSGQAKGFVEFLWSLPKDYTISDDFRWGNSLVTLFLTQRGILMGLPLTLIIIGVLWRMFSTETNAAGSDGSEAKEQHKAFSIKDISPGIVISGLLAGTLVLVHLHSLLALFVICLCLLLMRPEKNRIIELMAFAAAVAAVAIPELIWSMTGTATDAAKFIEWHFGWDNRGDNIIWFWFKNTGLLFPLLFVGTYFLLMRKDEKPADDDTQAQAKPKKKKAKTKRPVSEPLGSWQARSLLLFYIPFVLLFIIANVVKLAPWQWDNVKILIYWYVGSLPFVAYALARIWRAGTPFKPVVAVCLFVLAASGSLDVWRTMSKQINYGIFSADGVALAERAKTFLPRDTVLLNGPTYKSVAVLTGRVSLMRHPGHLGSHGIDPRQRHAEINEMYRGGPQAMKLFEKYNIEYVLFTPDEVTEVSPNQAFFQKFPVVAQFGQYRLYRVRNTSGQEQSK
ncbi:MAG: hypothetical protein KF855_06275 [Acidobacteria bacterium]|nr:hypothetical protein [Acidobacteriota bacterium]